MSDLIRKIQIAQRLAAEKIVAQAARKKFPVGGVLPQQEITTVLQEYENMRDQYPPEYDEQNNKGDKLVRAAMSMLNSTLAEHKDVEWPEDFDLTVAGHLMSNQLSKKRKLAIAASFILAQLKLEE